jgi:hypothetical protein
VSNSAANFEGTAWCDAGDKATGGGYTVSSAGSTGVSESWPVDNGSGTQGWRGHGYLNFGWVSGGFDVYVVCADTTP